jgi:hypothetical protein
VQKAAPATVLEYCSPKKDRGMIMAFTQSGHCKDLNIKARGVSRERTYEVTFSNSGERVIMSGYDLASFGVYVSVGLNMSSELIMYKDAGMTGNN